MSDENKSGSRGDSSESFQEVTEYEGHDPLVGQVIGKYKIIDRVARGGTATVYKAIDQVLKREVAFKILHQHLESRKEVVERFRTEAQTVASLRHPNILNVYDFFNENGRSVLVAEFMPGYTLSHLIKKFRRLPEDIVLMLIAEILQGLREAHARGFTHRDIKPANILLHSDHGVKVSDFGLAKLANADDGLTKEGVFIGTPSFSSPEQIEGKKVDHRTDLFSLGLTAYMMLTGHHAFKQKGDSTTTVWFKIVRGKFQGLRELDAGLSQDLEKILEKALQVDREKRYASADQMLHDVLTALKRRAAIPYQEPLRAYLRNPHGQSRNPKPLSRPAVKWAKLSVAALVTTIVLAAAWVFWSLQSPSDREGQETEVIALQESEGVPPEAAEDLPAPEAEVESPQPAVERPARTQQRRDPPLSPGAQSGSHLLVSDQMRLLFEAGDEGFFLRFLWAGSEHSFRLVDEDRGRQLIESRFSDAIFDWDSWAEGDFSWAVAGRQGQLQIENIEAYRSEKRAAKRDLPVSSAFNEVDLRINPWVQQLRLTWEGGPGADTYRVEVAEDENFQSLIFSGVVPNRYVQVDRLWSQNQSLYWRVQYLDSSRNVFYIDPIRRLNLQLRVSSSHFDVIEPRAFQRVGDQLFIRSVAPEGVEVSCGEMDQDPEDWTRLENRAGFLEGELSFEGRRLVCQAEVEGELMTLVIPLRPS